MRIMGRAEEALVLSLERSVAAARKMRFGAFYIPRARKQSLKPKIQSPRSGNIQHSMRGNDDYIPRAHDGLENCGTMGG